MLILYYHEQLASFPSFTQQLSPGSVVKEKAIYFTFPVVTPIFELMGLA